MPGNGAKPNTFVQTVNLVLLHSLVSDWLPVTPGCSVAIVWARAGLLPPA